MRLSLRSKICEVVTRFAALHAHFERPDSVAAKLYGALNEGLMYLTSCGTAACTEYSTQSIYCTYSSLRFVDHVMSMNVLYLVTVRCLALICNAFLDCGLVRHFVEDLRRPEMCAARETSMGVGNIVELICKYLCSLLNVARLPEFNSRFVTLAREVHLVATLKDYSTFK